MSRQAGFTLLESLVTLVILSVFASGILTWLNSSVSGYQRLEQAGVRLTAFRNAAEIMATVNPMDASTGKILLAPYEIAWRSEQLQFKPAVQTSTGSYYDVALYETTVDVHLDTGLLGTFKLTQVGFKQTRSPVF